MFCEDPIQNTSEKINHSFFVQGFAELIEELYWELS